MYYVAQTPTYVDVYVHCVLRDALEYAGTAGRRAHSTRTLEQLVNLVCCKMNELVSY